VILFFGFGGKRPWRRAMAESKITGPSPPALAWMWSSLVSTIFGFMPEIKDGEELVR